MPRPSLPPTIDPLRAFLNLEGERMGRTPVPLVSTAIDAEIEGGMVVVSTTRVFRNTEAESIEATMTFPVPVQATLFALEARVDGRVLQAVAQRCDAARETYETAVADGKTAVLHEEVLKGIHMVSVAPLAPGGEIEVLARWVTTLSFVGGRGQVRLPLTVGEIYGRSPLADSDNLLIEGRGGDAELRVRCRGGCVSLVGGTLSEGQARVPLDAPVDLVVDASEPRALHGTAADGRALSLRIAPAAEEGGQLDVAVLIDHSGSMEQIASGVFGGASNHQLVVAGLVAALAALQPRDDLDLWEFDDTLTHVGCTSGGRATIPADGTIPVRDRFRALIARLQDPRGGTEIGGAIDGVIRGSAARDLLLVTDGKSFALDVQALARNGRRISVVLVGEDSLEANVGHLAALTGGDVFVAIDEDISACLAAALASLRSAHQNAGDDVSGDRLRLVRRNAVIEVEWRAGTSAGGQNVLGRAAAALVAGLRLGGMSADEAAELAEAEGLVTHLTSLVLVDHQGEAQEGIPTTRKVPLPEPRTAFQTGQIVSVRYLRMFVGADDSSDKWATDHVSLTPAEREARVRRKLKNSSRLRKLPILLSEDTDVAGVLPASGEPPQSSTERAEAADQIAWSDLFRASEALDWNANAARLASGDLSSVPSAMAKEMLRLAGTPLVLEAAGRLERDPLILVIGILARYNASRSRGADRFARQAFRGMEDEDIGGLLRQVSACQRRSAAEPARE